MHFFDKYQLFLFDFDGLLVNTEHLHMEAYRRLVEGLGFSFDLTFNAYCEVAHRDAGGPRRWVYATYPELQEQYPDWAELYQVKSQNYSDLVAEGKTQLMPGVLDLLTALQERQIPHAVVTHSQAHHIALVRQQHPILQGIPHWITREHYQKPKPDPECYTKAIALLAKPADQGVGFEDTPRGLTALMGTRAKPVIVSQPDYPLLEEAKHPNVLHLTSLDQVLTVDAG